MSKLIKKRRGFTQVDNEIINDVNISLQAKGLYLYMESKPEVWEFSIRGMSSQLKESHTTILRVIKELENFGYLEKIKNRINGKQAPNDYILHETPIKALKKSGSRNENQKMRISNTESVIASTSNTILSNKEKSNMERVKNPTQKEDILEEPLKEKEIDFNHIKTFLDLKSILVSKNRSSKGEQFIYSFEDLTVSISDLGVPYFRDGANKNNNLTFLESDNFYKSCLIRKKLIIEHINKHTRS